MAKYSVKDAPKYVVVTDRGLVVARTVSRKDAEKIAARKEKRDEEIPEGFVPAVGPSNDPNLARQAPQ
jgi:hypothetical protein